MDTVVDGVIKGRWKWVDEFEACVFGDCWMMGRISLVTGVRREIALDVSNARMDYIDGR